MSYYFATRISGDFADALQKTREALRAEGFGIISEIDIQNTLKEKIGVDFRPYTILGACNPIVAHEALQIEDKVGTMLPCNVVVQQMDGGIEVAAIDPVASMQAIHNPRLDEKAALIAGKLSRVIESVAETPETAARSDERVR
jgi:uncharacterized protein (DUF302 family)